MEKMAALMENMMKNAAKKDDIAAMSGRVKEVEGTVKGLGVKVETIENNMINLRAEIGALQNREPTATTRAGPRTSSGRLSAAASSTSCSWAAPPSCSTSRAIGWNPRLIHCKGWSPYGAGESTRIGRAQALQVQEALWQRIPQEVRDRLRWLAPFLSSHRLSAEVLMCSQYDCRYYSDMISLQLQIGPPGPGTTYAPWNAGEENTGSPSLV